MGEGEQGVDPFHLTVKREGGVIMMMLNEKEKDNNISSKYVFLLTISRSQSLMSLLLADASLASQPCTGTFKLLTIMQLHNDC